MTHSSQSLPPTKDALYLHFERSNYQCRQWKKALDHVSEEPKNHGRKNENGSLEISWANEKPAPESILEFVTCNCRKSRCIKNQCSCKAVGLPEGVEVLKKRIKMNRGRGGQTYLYVRSCEKKLPDFRTADRVLSDKLLAKCFLF